MIKYILTVLGWARQNNICLLAILDSMTSQAPCAQPVHFKPNIFISGLPTQSRLYICSQIFSYLAFPLSQEDHGITLARHTSHSSPTLFSCNKLPV